MTKDLQELIHAERTIAAAFELACEQYPERTAVIFLGTRYTYRTLLSMVQRFAGACRSLGIRSHDRVLIYLPSSPQWIVAYLAVQKIGAVPVPVSAIYTPRELVYLMSHSGSETVICADTNFGYVEEALPDTAVRRIIVTRLTDLLPLWKRVAGRLFDRVPTGAVRRGDDVHDFTALLWAHSPLAHDGDLDPDTDLAHILYTGGTTGFPKGVPHTHAELLSGIVGLREMYRSSLSDVDHTLVLPLPLFHMFSQDMMLGLGFHLANAVVILPKPSVDAVLAAIQQHRGTVLIGVPSLYRQILENDRLDLYDLGSLAWCWSAGDVLPRETAARWKAKFGLPIYQVYGSTETVCIAASPLGRDPDPTTVGQLVPTRQALVVDPETLEEVESGSAGELLITSEYSYRSGGYWNNETESQQSYVTLDGQTWCRTGDFVKRTPRDEFEFVDRRADLIKHKGFRISASRVESVLQDHRAVKAAAVVGTPDPVAGENVKAFVILHEDTRGVTGYDLTKHCRERLLPYEVPDYIEFRDMLPKSKVGKVLRRELRDQ